MGQKLQGFIIRKYRQERKCRNHPVPGDLRRIVPVED